MRTTAWQRVNQQFQREKKNLRTKVLKGDQHFQRETNSFKERTKVWQRVRPTVSKGEQKGDQQFQRENVANVETIRERGHGTRHKAEGFGPEDWS